MRWRRRVACGKENFALRGILIPFDVRLRRGIVGSYIPFFPLSQPREFCVGSLEDCRNCCRSGELPCSPIADSMKVRITCTSAPIRLRRTIDCSGLYVRDVLKWNFCWRYVTRLMKEKYSVCQIFRYTPRKFLVFIALLKFEQLLKYTYSNLHIL